MSNSDSVHRRQPGAAARAAERALVERDRPSVVGKGHAADDQSDGAALRRHQRDLSGRRHGGRIVEAELRAVDQERDAAAVPRPDNLVAAAGAFEGRDLGAGAALSANPQRLARAAPAAPLGGPRDAGAVGGDREHGLACGQLRARDERRGDQRQDHHEPHEPSHRDLRGRGWQCPFNGHCALPWRRSKPQAPIIPTWQSAKSKRTGSAASRRRRARVMSAAMRQPGLV